MDLGTRTSTNNTSIDLIKIENKAPSTLLGKGLALLSPYLPNFFGADSSRTKQLFQTPDTKRLPEVASSVIEILPLDILGAQKQEMTIIESSSSISSSSSSSSSSS